MTHRGMAALTGLLMLGSMVFAGSAGATFVTAPEGSIATGTSKAVNTGVLVLDSVADIECGKSEVEGTLESHGASVTAKGTIPRLTLEDCGPHVVEVVSEGTLEIHTNPEVVNGSTVTKSAADGNGTLTSSGAEVTIEVSSIFGEVHCTFVTDNTLLGTITGAPGPTGHATLDITAVIPVDPSASSVLCGSSADWTGSYQFASPTGLVID